jgi:hypothetical protein
MSAVAIECHHCKVSVFIEWKTYSLDADDDGTWLVYWSTCPACQRVIIVIGSTKDMHDIQSYVARPLHSTRHTPAEVPDSYASDFKEASAVLTISAKASAAISRRLLQHVLKDEGQAKKRDLIDQIDEILPTLPAYLQDLHAIRHIGNFAAHPSKDKNTGEIVAVEPGEAEWLLDILSRLFDFYFVQPAIRATQVDALNKKLKAAGKPEIRI